MRTKSQPIKWTSNYFGVEKHFSTHARVYSIKVIKQNTKTKKKQRICFTAFKNSVFTSRYYTALQTVDVQELVTVQQMANGNFEKGGGTAKYLAIQVFLELFFEET